LRVVAVPVLAWLWWALAFLPWQGFRVSAISVSVQPTLPIIFGDLGVAVFGPVGASLVVMGLARRWGLALLSVGLGFLVPAAVTLTRGVAPFGFWPAGSAATAASPFYVNPTEGTTMLLLVAVSALAGLGIGLVAIGSLLRFGFFGLLAVIPVVGLLAALFVDSGVPPRWLTGAALAVLMVMIAWARWSRALLWPVFFVLFWLLVLANTAVQTGAVMLRQRGGGTSVGTVADAMLGTARSAWRVLLAMSWEAFWPAAIAAALVIGSRYLWQRTAAQET
jgi:hypothetical protein